MTELPPIRALLGKLELERDSDAAYLIRAEDLSLQNMELLRSLTRQLLRGVHGLDIVAFGSLARHEWTHNSDLDFLIIVGQDDVTPALLRSANSVALKCVESLEASQPGLTGTFGSTISSFELVSRIGLESDTNSSTTRRILILEESASLFNKISHDRLVDRILTRYLVEYETPKIGVPRLLLNDVVRYWRTIAVDYQAKNWARNADDGWGLRYLKLRITRKLCFAAMLAALFRPAIEGTACDAHYLARVLEKPALARLGVLHEFLDDGGVEALRECLQIAGKFNGMLSDREFRLRAASIDFREGKESRGDDFVSALGAAGRLQECLSKIFFDSNKDLTAVSIKYGLF